MTPSETFGWFIFNGIMFTIWLVLKVLDTLYPRGCPCLTQHRSQPEHQDPQEHQQQSQHLRQAEHQHHEDAEHCDGHGHAEFRRRANSAP